MGRMSLVEFARYAGECAMHFGEDEELPGILLIMEVDGDAHHALIPGHQARELGDSLPLAIQAVIAQHDATYAAMAMESWHAKGLRRTDSELARRLLDREIQVSDLPPELRGEGIFVVAEDRANGRAFCQYEIGPPGADGHRQFTDITGDLAGAEMTSRFLPFFQIRAVCATLGCDETTARAMRAAVAPLLLERLGVATMEVSAL